MIIQGSDSVGVESVISSIVGKNNILLILANGAYGERIVKMAVIHGINHYVLRFTEDEEVSPEATENFLLVHPEITHVAAFIAKPLWRFSNL